LLQLLKNLYIFIYEISFKIALKIHLIHKDILYFPAMGGVYK